MKASLLILTLIALPVFGQTKFAHLPDRPSSGLSFAPVVTYSAGGADTNSVAVADVNGDGRPDIVVANFCAGVGGNCGAGSVGVLLSNGNGTFQPVSVYGSGGYQPSTVIIADVNGDGRPDLVVANSCVSATNCSGSGTAGSVGILLGNGDGTFQAAIAYDSGGNDAWDVAVADVNGDGKADIVVANRCPDENCGGNGDGVVSVLFGHGDGTFESAVPYDAGGLFTFSVAVADVNNDGRPDIIVADSFASYGNEASVVGVLLGNGDGTFQQAATYLSGGGSADSVAVTDVNGDGFPDLIVANCGSNGDNGCDGFGTAGVLLNNGDGTFQSAKTYSSGYASSVAVGDVNGDGRPDLILADICEDEACDSGVNVLLGNGDGTFQAATSYGSGGRGSDSVAVADINGDHKPDIAVSNASACGACTNGSVGVLINTTTFSPNLATLANFDGANGANPFASLVQGLNGDLYGTAEFAGANCTPEQGCGTVFEVAPDGLLVTLYSFCQRANCEDGAGPRAALVETIDGTFYGTTENNGAHGKGVVFKITPTGTFTTLYNFCQQRGCVDGANPVAGLVQGAGNFYGTTRYGGANNYGEVFEISIDSFTVLHSFCSQPDCSDGAYPDGPLVRATNGNFYGITRAGGISGCNLGGGCGTVFKISPAGAFQLLYSFCAQLNCTDGANPEDGLLEATDGNLYGTTEYGGSGSECGAGACGTIFKITLDGKLTTLYNFCLQVGCPDGAFPYAGLVEGTDGNLYGTTSYGGASLYDGTIFRVTKNGKLTTLYSFCSEPNCSDGSQPLGGLVQDTDGMFYGTTYAGGVASCTATNGCGTVFSLDVGLSPFVAFVRNAGSVGETGPILGQGLAGATNVMLNGVPANFTVVSDTYIRATVPPGATTGYVTVSTPTRVLTSNVPFHVIR